MPSSSRPVVVKRIPEAMNSKRAHAFFKEIQPVLISDRPQIVFDMSKMRHVDSIGIAVFLHCMRQAMIHDGDIRMAGVLPQAAAIFELTRIGRLFEMYDNSTAAAKSFSSFLPNAPSTFHPHPAPATVTPVEAVVEDVPPDKANLAA